MARELKIRITGDATGLQKATGDAEGILSGFGARVGALGVAAGNLLADGVKAGVRGIAGFMSGSIGAAADMNETVSKIGVVFGDAAPQVQAFAADAAKALGQSRQQALDAAATFAVFGKSAGLSGDNLVGFSTSLVQVATDLASINNTSAQDAIDAITQGLRGEQEGLRRYGILLDDATLRQQALELGIISSTKNALTPQQKVLAAQQVVFKQAAYAANDFKNTSGGLAGQQKILTAQVANLKTTLGQAFLPAALAVTTALSKKLLPVLEKFGPLFATEIAGGFRAFGSAFRAFDGDVTSSGFPGFMERVAYWARVAWEEFEKLLPTLQTVAGVVSGVAGQALQVFADNWDRIREALVLVGPELAAVVGAFVATGRIEAAVTAFGSLSGVLTGLGAFLVANPIALAVAALAGAFVLAYRHSETFRAAVDKLAGRFMAFVETVKAAFDRGGFGEAFRVAVEGVKNALGELGGWLTSTALPFLGEKALQLAGVLGGWIADAARYVVDNLPGWLGGLVEWLVGTALPTLIIEASKLSAALAEWIYEASAKLRANLPGWLASFAEWVLTEAGPAVRDYGNEIASQMVSGLIRGLFQMAGKLRQAVSEFVDENMPGVVKSLLRIDSPSKVFQGFGENIAEGLALGMQNGSSMVASAASGLAVTSAYGGPGGFGPAELPGSGRWSASPIVVETYIDGRQVATALAPHQRAVERAKR